MCQIISQILQGGDKPLHLALGGESRQLAQPLVASDNLSLIGKLQAIEQAYHLAATAALLLQLDGFLHAPFGKILPPRLLRANLIDHPRHAQLADGHQPEQPHPHG